jgi:Uma2 family endonuclease
MPLPYHQLIVKFLFQVLDAFVTRNNLGTVLFAPLPVHLRPGKYREPDIVFLKKGRSWGPRQPPQGADLVIEVVSEGKEDRERNFEIKRKEYAKAQIDEYWIVDPKKQRILVLTLARRSYKTFGEFGINDRAQSNLLAGFEVAVKEVIAAGMTTTPNKK